MNKYFLHILLITSHILLAETLYVPNDYSTIQSAIDASEAGDSVLVSPGFYPESINFNGNAIIVSSLYLIENDSLLIGTTIINAQENGSVVTFNNGESNLSAIKGFTLENGTGNNMDPDGNGSYYTYGGGVYCESSSPIIQDCIIQNNSGDDGGGGGIFCYNASPTFLGCTILGNETNDVGGGLYSRSGSSPEFFNCAFINNVAEFGGGCYLRYESSPQMTDVIFTGNTSNNSGGGLVLKDDANLIATRLNVTGNSADGLGGGLYVNNANPVITFTLIANNSSSSGAGAYFRNSSTAILTNITLVNNLAELYGNGIYMRDGSEVSLLNSIVWGNGNPQIYFRTEGAEVELNVDYSDIENGQAGIDENDNGNVNWGNENIDSEPYFCNDPGGVYTLRENSPCVDSGFDGLHMGCYLSGCGPVNIGPIWYVDQYGNDTNDGSPETPFETIERAISAAMNGDTIRLNPGPYYESLDFSNKEIVLESRAFELNNSDLILNTYFTPGSMGGSCLVLNGSSNDNAIIRGIAFRDGATPNGGGLHISNCSPTISDIIVENNTAEVGGGIYLSESDAILMNITIRENGANTGAGIYVVGGSPIISNASIYENIAYWGSGVYSENSDLTIINSIIKENVAFIEGGGLYQLGGNGTIQWTLFEYNHGYDFGGAIVVNQATLGLDQTTFTENISGEGSVMTLYSSAIEVKNSIFWNNDGRSFYSSESSGMSSMEISYSDLDGGEDIFSEFSTILFSAGDGIHNEDPAFCDPESYDYSLSDYSNCRLYSDSGGLIGAINLPCNIMVLVDNEIYPVKISLFQNFPNPFNPITTIQYVLQSDDWYSLRVFNMKGQLVNTLKNELGSSGNHSVLWDARDSQGSVVPSGIYIYQLVTDNIIINQKMILLK
ncbi:MAG: T9SS type A sorting domain-containing protein [Candidatus Marinimicrobia bacterium]|nr:T9SS type A sorting domain-containing protein [Candidatus Neomarinimicrobiota bacterium]